MVVAASIKKTVARYTKTNIPPPFSPVIYGNFHTFPNPTALPAAANINPILENLFVCIKPHFFSEWDFNSFKD